MKRLAASCIALMCLTAPCSAQYNSNGLVVYGPLEADCQGSRPHAPYPGTSLKDWMALHPDDCHSEHHQDIVNSMRSISR